MFDRHSIFFPAGLWCVLYVRYKLISSYIFTLLRLLSKNLKIKIYRTIILPVVLYGCETWSLTLREERKVRVFREQGVEENIWT